MLLRTRFTATRRGRATVTVVGAVVAAGLFSGCSAVDGFLEGLSSEAPRDENGEVTEAADAGAMTVQVGDCIDVDALGEQETFTDLPVIPCDDEHTGEIYAEKVLDDGDYPGDDSIQEEADTFCGEEFEGFVGMPYADSALYYWSFYPTKDSWRLDDRTIQCVLESEDPVTGSLEGAAL